MDYRLMIKNIDGSLQWEVPFDNFTISEELNNDRAAQFTVNRAMLQSMLSNYNITPYFLFKAAYREAYLYDASGNLLYSGFVDEMQMTSDMETDGQVTITSKGFFSLLDKRITNSLRTYSAQDAGDIAWDLINYTQGLTYGALGITRGVHPATINRDRTYNYDTIKSAIEGLSNKNILEGFDFEIDNSKVFNIYFIEKGTIRTNLIAQYGFNIDAYQITENGLTGLINQAVVLGENFGTDVVTATRDAEADYKANYGLLQNTLSAKDTQEVATLNDAGDKYLMLWKFPRKTIVLTMKFIDPLFTNYSAGDRIKVIIDQEGINDFYRVKIKALDNTGKVTLTCYPV